MADEYVFIDEWEVEAPQEAVFDALAHARNRRRTEAPVDVDLRIAKADVHAGVITGMRRVRPPG